MKTSSYIVGFAANPNATAMAVFNASGHGAVCHGAARQLVTFMGEQAERDFHQAGLDALRKATSQFCKGFKLIGCLILIGR